MADIFVNVYTKKAAASRLLTVSLAWKKNFTGENLISRFLLKIFSICSASQEFPLSFFTYRKEFSSGCFPGHGVLLQPILEKPNKKNAVRHDEKISKDLERGFQKYGPDVTCHRHIDLNGITMIHAS